MAKISKVVKNNDRKRLVANWSERRAAAKKRPGWPRSRSSPKRRATTSRSRPRLRPGKGLPPDPVVGHLDVAHALLRLDPESPHDGVGAAVEEPDRTAGRGGEGTHRGLGHPGGGVLQRRADVLHVQLHHGALVALLGFVAAGLQAALHDHLPPARVDPNQLELAILNLAINARDAMPRGGALHIVAEARSVAQPGRIAPGDYVRISVIDEGTGMDSAVLGRAIEPFFSTKGVGKGTGLGLSMVHGLAAQLGGMLDLRSSPGQGTTAEIWLPIASEPATIDEVDRGPVKAAARRATILLVDDEELVRGGTADMLSEIGYDVIEATSGADALRLVRDGLAPDLMITDYLMPGLNGVELIQAMRAIAPDTRVMLITGYSTIAEGPGASVPRLAKPFRHADLAQFVAELLGAKSTGTVLQFRTDRGG